MEDRVSGAGQGGRALSAGPQQALGGGRVLVPWDPLGGFVHAPLAPVCFASSSLPGLQENLAMCTGNRKHPGGGSPPGGP